LVVVTICNHVPSTTYSPFIVTCTGKRLTGPVVLKLDSGPGRIVASHESILESKAYYDRGLVMLAGLPNATSVQQDMEALYRPFKSATYN
jgi:hypothetical protein